METLAGGWMSFVLVAVAGMFGYHCWRGWRTGIVRFPLSLLAVQEVERGKGPTMFWGVMIADALGGLGAFAIAAYVAGGALAPHTAIPDLRALNGCYEGEGLPDVMRPPVHWHFRIADGVLFDRAGRAVSRLRLVGRTAGATSIAFSPGILVSNDANKRATVDPGDTVDANAFRRGGGTAIALADDWGDVMWKTSCG
jgi:hypothetical protein